MSGTYVAALAGMLALMPGNANGALTAPGAAAPGFTLPSQEGTPVSLSSYRGQWVVLYFYPKDESSGCTIEAHNFQRDLPEYQALHSVILGVSLDTVASHRSFCARDSLTFKLLADPGHQVTDAYGVPLHTHDTMHYAERTTFLISPSGKVAREWTVRDIQSHSAEVLATLHSLENQ
jgi:peroxiredoxin Q/BCP